MKKIRTILALALALILAVSLLAGCGSSGASADAETADTAKEDTAPAAETTEPADSQQTEEPAEPEEKQETETPEAAPEAGDTGTHTVIDDTGREVEVPNQPQRIAIGSMVMPNMVYALQGTLENVVSIPPSAYTGWEISMLRYLAPEVEGIDTTMVNDDFSVNVEALANAGVDLVVNFDSETDSAAQLEALGIPCVLIARATDVESLMHMIEKMGETLNCQERTAQALAWYEETNAYFDTRAAEIEALGEEEIPRVLLVQKVESLTVYGKGNNPYIATLVGGNPYLLPVEITSPTMEDIIEFNPEIIFLSNFDDYVPDDLYENRMPGQDWSGVDAVVNHRVYKVPAGLYRWSPPMTFEKPLYMKWIATKIQPELFADLDLEAEIVDFYKSFYNYDLSEEQLNEIFRVEANKNSQ